MLNSLTSFIRLVCLFRGIQTVGTLTIIELLFLPAGLLSMELIVTEIYKIIQHEYNWRTYIKLLYIVSYVGEYRHQWFLSTYNY